MEENIADSESENTNEEESVLGQAEEKRTDAEPRSIENTGRAQNTQNTGDVHPAAKVVETQDGLVQGVEGRTDEGKVFHKYLGVPYAAPPVGSLRSSLDILNPTSICSCYACLGSNVLSATKGGKDSPQAGLALSVFR